MRAVSMWVVAGAALAVVAGCGEASSGLSEGERCVRSAQCAPGLACAAGRCALGVGDLGDEGTVPPSGEDAGPVTPPEDAGGMVPDAGPTPEPDAGPEPEPDAGPEPEPDAGPEPEPDAGPEPEPDAGSEPEPDGGAVSDGGMDAV